MKLKRQSDRSSRAVDNRTVGQALRGEIITGSGRVKTAAVGGSTNHDRTSRVFRLTISTRCLDCSRETLRPPGILRTCAMTSSLGCRMTISSPAFVLCEGFAARPLRKTKPASHSFWATVRRGQRRLSLRKRSRRISPSDN